MSSSYTLPQLIKIGNSFDAETEVPKLEVGLKLLQSFSTTVDSSRPLDIKNTLESLPANKCTISRLFIIHRCYLKDDFTFYIAETLKEAIPAHLIVGIDMLFDIVVWFYQRLLTYKNNPRTACRQGAVVLEGILNKLVQGGFDPQILTPVHTGLLSLHMMAGDTKNAVPVASKKFTSAYAPSQYSETVLLFFYYSGIVFCWDKNYEAAENCFELVCFSPRLSVPSWIVVCALRKLILVSLILRGRMSEEVAAILRTYSNARDIENPHFEHYIMLADSYSHLKWSAFRGLRDSYRVNLKNDGNWGLVKVAELHMARHLILKMQSLYSVCTIKQIIDYAEVQGPNPLEKQLCDAVNSLNQSGMGVSFVEPSNPSCRTIKFEENPFPPSFSSRDSITDFENRVNGVLEISKTLEVKRQNQKPIPPKVAFTAMFTESMGADVDDDDDVMFGH